MWALFTAAVSTSSESMATLAVVALVVTVIVIGGARWVRWLTRGADPAPIFGRALLLHAYITLPIALAAVLTDYLVRLLAVSSPFLLSFYAWGGFPFRDLNLQIAGDPQLPAVSLLLGAIPLLVALLCFLFAFALDRDNLRPDGALYPSLLRRWGHQHGRPERWLRVLLGITLAIMAALLLLQVSWLPMFRAPGALVMPAWTWGLELGGWLLLVGLWLSAGAIKRQPREKPRVEEARPEAELVPSERRAWERALQEAGFVMDRLAVSEGEAGLEAAPVSREGCDLPNLPAAAGRSSGDQLLLGTIFGPGAAAWQHQARFVDLLEAQAEIDAHRRSAVLLHTGLGSGRSAAVFEACARAWLGKGKRSLLLYPDKRAAAAALQELLTGLEDGPHGRVAVCGPESFTPTAPPAILVTSVDWAVEHLLPQRSDHRLLFRDVGLVVLEDIEELSGVRATNMALVVFRLRRLVERAGGSPTIGLTACCNPTKASGVREFAERLTGGFKLVEEIRDSAPRSAVHLYALERVPGLTDATRVDLLPPALQAAWFSHAWRAPTYHHARAIESDLIEPDWVSGVRELQGGPPLQNPQLLSWVQVHEVELDGILSMAQRVAHGGVAYELQPEHLVILSPSMRCHGLARALMRWWVESMETSDPEMDPGRWFQLLVPMGTRLVCGSPGRELLEKHLLGALKELPATREELLDLFPEYSDDLRQLLSQLLRQGVVHEQRVRRLVDGEVIEQKEFTLDGSLRVITPLDTVTGNVVRLVDASSSRSTLTYVDRAHAFRVAYPGRLFLAVVRQDDAKALPRAQVFRITQDHFQDFIQRTEASPGQEVPWVACWPKDIHVQTFTEPRRARQLELDPAWLGARSGRQEHGRPGGTRFAYWRSHLLLREQHLGFYQYDYDKASYRLEPEQVDWRGPEISWALQADASIFALMEASPLRPNTAATLRRMLISGLRALTRIDRALLELDVLPRLGALDPEGTCSEHPAILLIDPFESGAGALDALDPWFVITLLEFTWMWARDMVSSGQTSGWSLLGYEGRQPGDEGLDPDVEGVVAVIEPLLGSWTRKLPADRERLTAPDDPPAGTTPPAVAPPPAAPDPAPAARSDPDHCACCGESIEGRFSSFPTAPERHFCQACMQGYERCDFCSAPVGATPRRYADHRAACPRCASTAVSDTAQTEALAERARTWLTQRMGMPLRPASECPITLLDADEMAHLHGHEFRPSRGYDPREAGTFRFSGTTDADGNPLSGSFTIFVEEGQPEAELYGTIVHELTHLWQFDHFPRSGVDPTWVEGLACWCAYHAQRDAGHEEGSRRIALSKDPIYGDGFRKVLALEQQVGMEGTVAAVLQRVGEHGAGG